MPIALLTLLKLVVLALLYLFLARAVRAVTADLFGPRRRSSPSPPRPAVADTSKRGKRAPRELVVHPPEGRPIVIPLGDEPVTLGRSERMTVALDDAYVSDEHALVARDGDGFTVRDLGSTNGTYLNGAKVTQPTPLSAGDQVRLGKTRVEVRR